MHLKNQGRSYGEIASALSLSKGTVKSFFSRKKQKSEEIHTVCKNGAQHWIEYPEIENFARIHVDTSGGEIIQLIIENV